MELLDDKGKTLGALSVEAVVNEGATPATYYPFRNPQLSNEERVENLISLLTPEEKVGLMMNKSISVDRLGIPPITGGAKHATECVRTATPYIRSRSAWPRLSAPSWSITYSQPFPMRQEPIGTVPIMTYSMCQWE